MATVTIQKRKRQNRFSYLIYFKEPFTGRKKYYKSFQRQKEAQQAANDLRILIDSGKLPEPHKNKIRMLSFDQVADQLERFWEQSLKTGDLKPATVQGYKDFLKAVRKAFGSKLLCCIKQKQIIEYRAEVATTSSNVLANRRLFVIKKVFQFGKSLHAVVEDPAKGIRYLSEKNHQRNRFVLPDELNQLIEASKQTRAKYYMPALICLGAEHGASRQEALSLRWQDINFKFGEYGMIRLFRTKNQRMRTEYLMPRSKKALLSWKGHQEWMRKKKKIYPNQSDRVFSHLDGSPIKSIRNSWKAICKITGFSDLHFHDLRHTFCSNLILSGANLKEVKEMIGHSDIAMTDRYSHLTSEHKLHRQKRLAEYYAQNDASQVG